MANKKRLIDANALCEFFQERYEYLRNASETQLPNGRVEIDLDIQVGAIIAKEFLDKAKQAPTVDAVEVVHGDWLYGERNKVERTLIVECSECGATFNLPMFEFGFCYNYCPNCGAKMDGDGNGNR